MKLYKDGKFLVDVGEFDRLEFVSTQDAAPSRPVAPKPQPVTPKPVTPKPQPTRGPLGPMVLEDLGALYSGVQQRLINLKQGVPHVYSFSVPVDTTVPLLFFNFAPQNSNTATWDLWLSETPDGAPMPYTNVRGAEKMTKLDGIWKRRGDTMAMSFPVQGRGQERRGYPLVPGQTYYFNVEVTGGENVAQTVWVLGGNWNWKG
jgi:hypothetical protein